MVRKEIRSNIVRLGIASASAALCITCSVSAVFTPVHLDAYHGDGVITKVRDFRTPGAQVEFEPFSLQTPYKKAYDLSGLPARPISYSIKLHVLNVPQFTWAQRGSKIGAEGILKFELIAASGSVIFKCEGSPEQIGWGQSGSTALGTPCDFRDPSSGWAAINPDDFKDRARVPATLEVEWSPGAVAPDLKARVVMKSGGTC